MSSFDKGIYKDLVFSLDFSEGSGNPNDTAKAHHPMTMSGTPTWTTVSPNGIAVNVLSFNDAHPDWIQCLGASTADLNFTSSAFSGCVWIYADSITGERWLISRGLASTDGWYFSLSSVTSGKLYIVTNQNTTIQYSESSAIAITTWYFVAFTRSGASGKLYINGIDKTTTSASHIDPLTSARKLHVGIHDGEALAKYDGYMYFPRIWSRALSPQEIWYLFQRERRLFGV